MPEQQPSLPPPELAQWDAPEASNNYGESHELAVLRLRNEQDAAHFNDGELFREAPEPLPKTPIEKEAAFTARVITLPEPKHVVETNSPAPVEKLAATHSEHAGRLRRLGRGILARFIGPRPAV